MPSRFKSYFPILFGVFFLFSSQFNLDATDDSKLEQAEKLIKTIAAKKAEARKLLTQSHEALDSEEYEQAINSHKKARIIEREAAELEKQVDAAMKAAVHSHLDQLSAKDYKTRQRATIALIKLGPRTIEHLRDALKESEKPETQVRLREIIASVGKIRIDSDGKMRQWASRATASTQYSEPAWSAMQATGKPDTPRAGDIQSAWAPSSTNRGEEWLQLTFNHSVVPAKVRIHETYNPGAVVKVEVLDSKGKWHEFWSGKDTTQVAPAYLEVTSDKPIPWVTSSVRVTLDTKSVAGYNEIDAVELIGEP